jgi:hypothetical protein
MSTATLETNSVGRCSHLLKGKPKASAGPKWKGVNGIDQLEKMPIYKLEQPRAKACFTLKHPFASIFQPLKSTLLSFPISLLNQAILGNALLNQSPRAICKEN